MSWLLGPISEAQVGALLARGGVGARFLFPARTIGALAIVTAKGADQLQAITGCIYAATCDHAGAPMLDELPYYVLAGDLNTRTSASLRVADEVLGWSGLWRVPDIGRTRAPRLTRHRPMRDDSGWMATRRSPYLRHRFPSAIISHAVWVYHRYCMSFRDVEDLLAERGMQTDRSCRPFCSGCPGLMRSMSVPRRNH
jgi:hypothetical protein